jgi:GTP-binding protein
MSKPVVAIVGRPNVGKSTLFNRLMNQRISIVEETAGVTRDRIYGETDWQGKAFVLIDTGGIESDTATELPRKVRSQVEVAVFEADLIMFVVDAKVGATHDDLFVASILRKAGKPILLVANKADNFPREDSSHEFFSLGLGQPILVSASNGVNVGDLLDRVIQNLEFSTDEVAEDNMIKVAIVGKPNVGKSLFVNTLLEEERLIVDDTPGTTRDAIDTFLSYNDQKYFLIDTAGVRRKSKVDDPIEYYSVLRTFRAVERANVVVLMLDAQEERPTEQDKRIAGVAHEAGKAMIIAVNKWDLIDKDTNTSLMYEKLLRADMKFLSYAPIVFISALTGQRIHRVLDMVAEVDSEHRKKISTGVLNEVIQDAVSQHQPPLVKGKQLRLYYATQTGIRPPKFTFFVNNPGLVHFSYTRFLENRIRDAFRFNGSPITITYRGKRT